MSVPDQPIKFIVFSDTTLPASSNVLITFIGLFIIISVSFDDEYTFGLPESTFTLFESTPKS